MSAHKRQASLLFKDTVERLNQLRSWEDEYMQVPFWPFSFTEALLGMRHGARRPEKYRGKSSRIPSGERAELSPLRVSVQV